jgi:hypothetical protein
VDYAPLPGAEATSLSEFVVLHIQVTGRSATPFHIGATDFGFQYADGQDPYRHSDDSRLFGVSPLDYQQFPPGLVIETVAHGQQKHRSVPLRASPHSRMLVFLTDHETPPDAGTSRLAQWIINTP